MGRREKLNRQRKGNTSKDRKRQKKEKGEGNKEIQREKKDREGKNEGKIVVRILSIHIVM